MTSARRHKGLSPVEEELQAALLGKLVVTQPPVVPVAAAFTPAPQHNVVTSGKKVTRPIWPSLNPQLPPEVENALHQALEVTTKSGMTHIKRAVIAVTVLNGSGDFFSVYNNWTHESKCLIVASQYIMKVGQPAPNWVWATNGLGRPLPKSPSCA